MHIHMHPLFYIDARPGTQKATETTVGKYLKGFDDRTMTESLDPRYFFKNAYQYLPDILEDLEPNRFFEHEAFSYDLMRREELGLFVLGPANSSTF